MSAQPADQRWYADEYLAWEREQPTKHELIDNYVIAMAGASREHNNIVVDTATSLNIQLRKKPCETYAGDMRIQVDPKGTYTYPDVVVICGEPQFDDEQHVDTLLNPTVIVEVLSPSTESIDRLPKLDQYRKLPSLQAYLIVSQDSARIELHTRQDKGWFYEDTVGLDATVNIESIDCELPLEDVYAKVQFSPVDESDDAE
jgi:Uma2 family endonuclease